MKWLWVDTSVKQVYSKSMDKENEKPYGVRIPSDLLEIMKTLAKEHDRSLNSELVRAIRLYVAQQEGEKQPQQNNPRPTR